MKILLFYQPKETNNITNKRAAENTNTEVYNKPQGTVWSNIKNIDQR